MDSFVLSTRDESPRSVDGELFLVYIGGSQEGGEDEGRGPQESHTEGQAVVVVVDP